ncbi:L-2,4-diaminobutyrate decarboxylase [Thermoactinomyces sp. DSM 45891]|uniref:pyridoxal phosphate-dependent decarboxylase family protein n=1 Tax=Thermoactinomyces sp. DSM 45891 TaxID=1761907 RepID=UPI000915EA24|nr:aspartate aminotransferase family protein [Thermoactinomyces sp. DSM 45891]SFX07626.1 L-2,4-diaminobutyrate decarboxylase [Thermoactinomyces sp. DSM 45891]
MNEQNWDHWFLNHSVGSIINQNLASETTRVAIEEQFAKLSQPYSGANISEIKRMVEQIEIYPKEGVPLTKSLFELSQSVLKHSIAVHHPRSIAHLHCAPLIPALAAEQFISATNQSMDSWDQSSVGSFVENRMIEWLCGLYGYSPTSDGVFTSGGTQSNFMGIHLARDQYAESKWNWNIQQKGLPPEASKLRILCSEKAHFTVQQSAALLGLGSQSVISIPVDQHQRMSTLHLQETIDRLLDEGLEPFSIIATAGTTDFGSIDPLDEIVEIAKQYSIWLHVDAAYGGALILSERESVKLAGISQADSITVDFHKLFYQPISCGAFLLRNQEHFGYIRLHADYLNPEDDEEQGVPNLVNKSIQTTRRFDACKLLISLQVLGENQFPKLIETTIDLARDVAHDIANHSSFEIINPNPEINAIVFRYNDVNQNYSDHQLDKLNYQIRQALLQSGSAVIAKTRYQGRVYLKFTLLNPRTQRSDIQALLTEITEIGKKLEGGLFAHASTK